MGRRRWRPGRNLLYQCLLGTLIVGSGNKVFKISMERSCAVSTACCVLQVLMLISSVSQFTLLASTKRGTKPDFHGALGGDEAKKLYDVFFSKVQENYKAERVKDGVFQAMMVSFCCEGLILLLTASLGSCPCE